MEEIDLKEVAKTFWSKKIHIAIILMVFIVIGAIYTYNFVVPKFSSNTTLLLASTNGTTSSDTTYTDTAVIDRDITVNSKLVNTYSELIKSKTVLSQVIANLDIDIDETKLKNSITVDTVASTEIIRITVVNESKELACYIANEVANVFKEQNFYDIDNVKIVDVAEIEENPSNVHHKRDILLFGLIGLVVSVGYVLVYNMLDTTVKSIEDMEEITQCTVLAALPILDGFDKTSTSGKKKGKSAKRGGKRNNE